MEARQLISILTLNRALFFKLLVFSHPVMVPLTDLFVYRLLGVNT